MLPIPRAELPEQPKDRTRFLSVVRAKPKERLSFTCLADELWQVWVHWDPDVKRNFPCFGGDVCPRCGPNAIRIWQAYMSGGKPNGKERFVVEITRGLALRLKAEGLLETSLYGVELCITRKEKNGSKNGAVILVEHGRPAFGRVPPRIDPMPALLRLWTWNEEHYEKLRVRMEALRQGSRDELAKLGQEVA